MLPTLIIITGQFRSGTSAVAQVVNRLGVPVAVMLGCPTRFYNYESDWEDPSTYAVLSRWRPLDGRDVDKHGFTKAIEANLEHRLTVERSLCAGAGQQPADMIASKCPLWALAMEDLREAASRLFRAIVCIRTYRPQPDIDRSVDRIYQPDMRPHIHRTNLIIDRELEAFDERWNLMVDYDDLVADPEDNVKRTAETIGVSYDEAASAVIRRR